MTTSAEAKRVWAMAQIEKARKSGNANPVIVMPVFINEGDDTNPNWVPTEETGIEGRNPEWCAVNVISSQRVFAQGFMNEQYRSALIRMKTVNNTFKAGEVLKGKLYVVEAPIQTNANDAYQDMKFLNADAQANKIPCSIGGEPIYRRVFYTENTNEVDQLLQHDNHDEIIAALAEIKALANKPNTNALKNASPVKAGKK